MIGQRIFQLPRTNELPFILFPQTAVPFCIPCIYVFLCMFRMCMRVCLHAIPLYSPAPNDPNYWWFVSPDRHCVLSSPMWSIMCPNPLPLLKAFGWRALSPTPDFRAKRTTFRSFSRSWQAVYPPQTRKSKRQSRREKERDRERGRISK